MSKVCNVEIIYKRKAAKTNEATVPTAKNDNELEPLPLVEPLAAESDPLELDEPEDDPLLLLLLLPVDLAEAAEVEEEAAEVDELVTAREAIPFEMVETVTQLELDGVE